ncbi:hypothetical protein AXF42_Ash010494 [Apostasia shenzhenica]|uniref:Bifunctional inhibitor/plant lipid transfer protein/seed storage helical domain-containing protein n=1 Tax=Apostasia shenzhenica TaxID=1088818 RepID=A0A2I0BE72_9ASPA|nr:hypothetical protein AXF42_Ash010494 [Apostasia shenzhenica]
MALEMRMRSAAAMAAAAVFLLLLGLMSFSASGQITTSCTSSLISSFTPCLNFLTGSTDGGGGGGSPTAACCSTLSSLISSSTQCACLIVTGNVPLSLPINRTLAVSLPRLCRGRTVPLQCSTAVGTPLPGPGPVSYAPSLPPLPPQPTAPAAGVDTPPPSDPRTASSPSISGSPLDHAGNQGQRPLILPNSVVKISTVHVFSAVVICVMTIILLS